MHMTQRVECELRIELMDGHAGVLYSPRLDKAAVFKCVHETDDLAIVHVDTYGVSAAMGGIMRLCAAVLA